MIPACAPGIPPKALKETLHNTKSSWWTQTPKQSPVCASLRKPNEHIYLVTGNPERPAGLSTQVIWEDESIREHHPEIPDQALYLGALEWAWSPAHNRLDSYYLSYTDDHWLLFDHALFDGDEWYWEWHRFGVAPKIDSDERAVGFWMLLDILKSDLNCWETDHFHIISGRVFSETMILMGSGILFGKKLKMRATGDSWQNKIEQSRLKPSS